MRALADWYPGDIFALAVLEMLVLITVFVALAWATKRWAARGRPAMRHALWLSALAGVLLSPVLVAVGPRLPSRVALLGLESAPAVSPVTQIQLDQPRERSQQPATVEEVAATPSPERPVEVHESAAVAEAASAPPVSYTRSLVTLVLLIWGIGSICLAIRLFHGVWRVTMLRKRLRPINSEPWNGELTLAARELSLRRLPSLYVSPEVGSPLVTGLFVPAVILPEPVVEGSTPEQARAILVHECAHLVRRDPWICLLQRLATIFFWVHPLVLLLNRRLNQAREEVCDNHVLAHARPTEYAETLLAVARLCTPVSFEQGYLTMMPRRHDLARRVDRLLDERRDKATSLAEAAVDRGVGDGDSGSPGGFFDWAASQSRRSGFRGRRETGKASRRSQAAGASVEGRIQDAEGKPLEGVGISVSRNRLPGESPRTPPTASHVKTGADGRYRLEDVPLGEIRISLNKPGYLLVRKTLVIEAKSGGKNQFDMVMVKRPPGGVVKGTVVDGAGKPVAGAKVIHRGADRRIPDVKTDARGEFRLENVDRDSPQQVFVLAPGFAPGRVELKPGSAKEPAWSR